MDNEFGSFGSDVYIETCKGCGEDIEVSAQRYAPSEYTTDIHVRCRCGESVHFEIPVN